jgi:hypothetical protein
MYLTGCLIYPYYKSLEEKLLVGLADIRFPFRALSVACMRGWGRKGGCLFKETLGKCAACPPPCSLMLPLI